MSAPLQSLPAARNDSSDGAPPSETPGLAALLGATAADPVRHRLLHAPRNRTKARVWLAEAGGRSAVIKEIATRPAWMRHLFGRALLRREARVYRALDGVAGVPALLSFPTPDQIVLSYVRAVPLPRVPRERLNETLFERLDRLVGEIHAHGIACGDIHHRNVLVTAGGEPALVDFAVATRRGSGWNPLRRWLFARLVDLDDAACVRMRLRYLRRAPRTAERARLERGAGFWAAGRSLKRALRAGRALASPGNVRGR